jgi:uncharacterized protein
MNTLCAVYAATCALALTGSPLVALADETTRNEEIVRNAFDTWTEGTYIFDQILAPDVEWTIHGSGPVAGTYTSMEDFVERASVPLVSRLATPLIPELHDLWAVGDTVIIRFDGSATTTSGAPYVNQFVWIFRMENGLVTEAEAFLDLMAYQEVVDNNAPRAD